MLRYVLPLALLLAFVYAFVPATQAPRGLAVVELFTSEGCSSCPPADRVLQELNERARATGEPIYALSFHVDYWDRLGWVDPFSSADYSARQREYTDRLPERTYTPQIVINGSTALIGSRREEVMTRVEAALAEPFSARLSASVGVKGNRAVIAYGVDGPTGNDERVVALLVQPNATTEVRRGENRGRSLTHVRIVRAMASELARKQGELSIEMPAGGGVTDLVLLLQAGPGGWIHAATSVPFPDR